MTAPGFRSLLASYEPRAVSAGDLVDLQAVHDGLRPARAMTIPSRVVHLPVAFDDSQTRAAWSRFGGNY